MLQFTRTTYFYSHDAFKNILHKHTLTSGGQRKMILLLLITYSFGRIYFVNVLIKETLIDI